MKNQTKQKGRGRLPLRAHIGIIGAAIVGGALIVVAVIYYLVFVVKPPSQTGDSYNQFAQQLGELERQEVPTEPVSQAIYYAQVAQNYENLGNYSRALDAYLKAQEAVDDNNLSGQIVYYEAIAKMYQEAGDTGHAREYLERYKAYLQSFLNAHPGDEPTQAALNNVEERLK